ncbi:MAG: hypothetical protein NT076_02120 [Candidatus Pacearchaeota archaeon]|nr:hypothetical protein [Candidatus Pacearchaeota archaeon]
MEFDAVYRRGGAGRGSAGQAERDYALRQQPTTQRYSGELPTQAQRDNTPPTFRGELSMLVALFAQILHFRRK